MVLTYLPKKYFDTSVSIYLPFLLKFTVVFNRSFTTWIVVRLYCPTSLVLSVGAHVIKVSSRFVFIVSIWINVHIHTLLSPDLTWFNRKYRQYWSSRTCASSFLCYLLDFWLLFPRNTIYMCPSTFSALMLWRV